MGAVMALVALAVRLQRHKLDEAYSQG